MAMASSVSFVVVVSSTLPLIMSSLLILCSYVGRVSGDDPSFRVVSVDNLTAEPLVCSRSKARPHNSLEIIHRHGPCYSYAGNKSVDHRQVLAWDSLRVAYLQGRLSHAAPIIQQKVSLLRATLPVTHIPYVVTVGLGTPNIDQPVNIDTGSDVCWVQCQPCLQTCFPQMASIFDPSTSSTYRNVSCTLSDCINSQNCAGNDCRYHVRYADKSYTSGFLAQETLTLTANDIIPNFIFGCGQNNTGIFHQHEVGVFGLARGRYSLVSQSASSLGNVFSYCLPRSKGSTGYLTIGQSSASSAQYTPMLTNKRYPSHYFIDLTGISVGRRLLPLSPTVFRGPGIIIDSGSTITYLPPLAYDELRLAFRNAMSQYPLAPPFLILDTCYMLSRSSQLFHPTITFHYNGTNVTLRSEEIFYAVGLNWICLAFTANKDPHDIGIIGATQQRGHEVIYDISAHRIGFAPNAC